jgi:hypothetical protein
MKLKYFIYIIILAAVASCKPDIDEFDAQKGSADFSEYLAMGNSLTAGFADGALYISGQENSYPNILATQFKTVGGGDFKQPMMPTELGVGISGTGQNAALNTKYVLGYTQDCTGETSLGPVLADPGKSQLELLGELTTSIADQGPFNNIGVVGARSIDLLAPGYGFFNDYYKRFAENPATDRILDEIAKVPYTFFTLWIGNNDVLGYALAGGEVDPQNPTAVITSQQQFSGAMDAIVGALTAGGQQGAIANIPDITSIPFFTTVPYNALELDQASADLLNQAYAQYNAAIDQFQLPVSKIEFAAGYNAFVIADTNSPYNLLGGFRQITSEELILLSVPQDSLKCAGWGSQKPIPPQFTLITSELDAIKTATEGYNQKISDLGNMFPIAHVDINKYLAEAATTGVVIDGVELNTTFIQGNIFSTDGIHLTPMGSAMVAHYFIEAINKGFGASIPQVNVAEFDAVIFP